MSRVPLKPRFLMMLGLALVLAVAASLAPLVLSAHGLEAAPAHAHHAGEHPAGDPLDEGAHPDCLKCVLTASSPPPAVTVRAVTETRVAGIFAHIAPTRERPFDPNAGARAPPNGI